MSVARGCFCAVLLWLLPAAAGAVELKGSLGTGVSEIFNGYPYDVYRFTAPAEGGIKVAAPEYGTTVIAVPPTGDPVITYYEALTVKDPVAGEWLIVVTTSWRQETAEYELTLEGAEATKIKSDEQMERVVAAFDSIGVEDPAAKIAALAEQLTLDTFREELREKINDRIKSLSADIASSKGAIDESDKRLASLLAAKASIESLTETKATIAALIETAESTARSDVEYRSHSQVSSIRERDALEVALAELAQVDELMESLSTQQNQLLEPVAEGTLKVLRETVVQLRRDGRVMATELAEKLLNSSVVLGFLFGGFAFLKDRPSIGDGQPCRTCMMIQPGVDIGNIFGGPNSFSVDLPSILGETVLAAAAEDDEPAIVQPVDPDAWLPEAFPWPPPAASSRLVLEKAQLVSDAGEAPKSLMDVGNVLEHALAKAGYDGVSYWGVPSGFALVTPLEQTDSRGAVLSDNLRWAYAIAKMKSFSLSEYLAALFSAPKGYFRVLIFAATSQPFAESSARDTLAVLEKWSEEGYNVLPEAAANMPFGKGHNVTVLVYEFLKVNDGDEPETQIPGQVTARAHLASTALSALIE